MQDTRIYRRRAYRRRTYRHRTPTTRWGLCLVTVAAMVTAVAQTGCSYVGDLPLVYKINIQQGNVLDETTLSQLEPGMPKQKVAFILGTPLLSDTFNNDRWDYFYSFKRSGTEGVQRRVSLFFNDDALDRIEGDVEPMFGKPPEPRRREVLVEVPKVEKDEGFIEALKPDFMKEDQPIVVVKPKAKETAAQETVAKETVAKADDAVQTAGATVTPLGQASAPQPGPQLDPQQEQAYLSTVLKGFGRDAPGPRQPGTSSNTGTSSVSSSVAAPGQSSSSQASSAQAPSAQDAEDDKDRGFFKDLVDTYQQWEKESAASGQGRLSPQDTTIQNEN